MNWLSVTTPFVPLIILAEENFEILSKVANAAGMQLNAASSCQPCEF